MKYLIKRKMKYLIKCVAVLARGVMYLIIGLVALVWKMKYLLIGIACIVLPIITWFSLGFVEAAGTTLFFWAIGIPMILVGADKLKPGGIWKTKGQGSGGSSGTEYIKIYHYDSKGKETGYTEIPKK